jgi:hypothetical protein
MIKVIGLLCYLLCMSPAWAATWQEPLKDTTAKLELAIKLNKLPRLDSKFYQQVLAYQKVIDSLAPAAKSVVNSETLIYESLRAGLDPVLIFSMVEVLSRFDAHAVDIRGNTGALQLQPKILEQTGSLELTLFNSHLNLRVGCILFRQRLDSAKGDMRGAILSFLFDVSPQFEVTEKTNAVIRTFIQRKNDLPKIID